MKRLVLMLVILSKTYSNAQPSALEEAGYILAMETVFTGMSYLANQKKYYGHFLTGGFDAYMGFAGIKNAFHKESGIVRIGYFVLSAGFFAKSLYNFHFSKDNSGKTQFWTNFIGYNVLVFSGYFLDTLE